jgi:hypothetical protein
MLVTMFSPTMSSSTIDSVDWTVLSKRYNDLCKKNISYEGSEILIHNIHEKFVIVDLYLKITYDLNNEKKTFKKEQTNFLLERNKEGILTYHNTHTSRAFPPNTNSLNIESYFLYNVISDYIKPYVDQYSF